MPWMVAVTEPRREKVAKRFIEEKGRKAYFPVFRDFPSEIIQPLFPNYLFVYDEDGIWRFLRNSIGIITFIMREGKPDLMPDRVMNSLRSYERNGVICLNEFHHGDKVRVTGSVFQGWDGIYLGMTSAGRCRVMLSMLGQEVPVIMESKYVKAAIA